MALSTADRIRLQIACGRWRVPACLKANNEENARRLYAYFRRGATPDAVRRIARLACECNPCRRAVQPEPVKPSNTRVDPTPTPPQKRDPETPPTPPEACPLPDVAIEPPIIGA